MIKQYLEAGRIVNTHGLSGEVKVEHWCDSAETALAIKQFFLDDRGIEALDVVNSRQQGTLLLISFDKIDHVDKAMALKNKTLYADRKNIPIPDGAVFISDILGLEVIDAATGKIYGKLTDVFNKGANDVYEIKSGEKTYLFPAVKEFIAKIDTSAGIFISPPKGIFDSEI
ncbi:Ribosome maturation factor RimM [bioreactor metagenome]|uniref:Ribosome maturation factor RimM n=1 Tax=bioreactor metagenome TaxID=1076179 RepID=A0A645BVL1_9ZZZZ|nr:ribosome maturation factor RimM [Oscillospiraceae bacterium]